jgi:hypothetical protein
MLEIIGLYAFRGTAISSIVIPSNVINISSQAFANCSRLTRIEIPATVINIGSWAFSGSSNLTTVIVHATTPPILAGVTVFNNTHPNLQIRVPMGSISHYREVWGPLLPAPGADRIVGF